MILIHTKKGKNIFEGVGQVGGILSLYKEQTIELRKQTIEHLKRERNELKISDFALNRSFINWVINKEPESEQFWIEWLMNNPEMAEKIETARSLLLALQFKEDCISSQQINAEWERCHRTQSNENK